MKTIQGINNYNSKNPSIITIGTFDGVHIGHQKIIERLIAQGKANGFSSVLLTFFPHPRMVLQKDVEIKLLNSLEEKKNILDKLGLDCLVVHPFTKAFSRLTASEFVTDILVNQLNVKKIIIGYDHRFGRNRNANIDDLKAFGTQFNFEVEEIPAQEINDVSVSSTKIRTALAEADIYTANKYLGYPYSINGSITKGQGIGKTIGFPTANISIAEDYKLVPANGVYAVECKIADALFKGMMNIGYRPTVDGEEKSIEVHLFDVDKDLYDQQIQVAFLHHIRPEKKFGSLQELSTQLQQDKVTALKLLG